MTKPDASGLLNAEHLEEIETQTLSAWDAGMTVEGHPPLTLADAVEALRRIKYHQSQQAAVQAEMDALVAPLQAQIDQVRAWGRDQMDDRQKRIGFHETRLHAFYRFNPPAKGKTLSVPGGKVSCRDLPAKWTFPDDANALSAAVLGVRPDLVKSEVVLKVDKADIKREARVEGGKAYLVDGAGELVELPVAVTEQPPTYKVETD